MNKYLARPWHLYRRGERFRRYFGRCAAEGIRPKLHFGCGNRPIQGWCNVDVAHLGKDVQYVDALRPLPFADGSFHYVFSEHFIEHLSFSDGLIFLREAARVLRRGGVLRTATPDLNFYCALQTAGSSKMTEPMTEAMKRYVDYTVGTFAPGQPRSPVASVNLAFYGWGHRFIYSAEFLQEVLAGLGFGGFRVCRSGESENPELRGIEQHGLSSPPEINDLETFVLEATRL